MTTLYTRVSEDFDPDAFFGVLVCSEELNDTYGFTQAGYDTADYDALPTVYEVTPLIDTLASEDVALKIGREAGLAIFDTHADIEEAAKAGTFKGSWANGDCVCLEETPINQLVLESSAFRDALADADVKGIRDYIAVGNQQPLVSIFWLPETVEMSGPVAIEPIDEDSLQAVRLATPTLGIKPAPRP